MIYYVDRLKDELKNILRFWQEKAIDGERFATQVSVDGTASFTEPLSTLYVARVLFGASAACQFLNSSEYKPIADLAYRTLRNQLSNPNGGFYWAVDQNAAVQHDTQNVAFAQAFVLYGLSEYYGLTGDHEVKKEMFRLIDFIESKIRNVQHISYDDGFDQDWNPQGERTKSLGTHLHLLEAYTKFINVTGNPIYRRSVEQLIEILVSRFVNPQTTDIFHFFDENWKLQPNESWVGHNLEAGWIILNSAKSLGNKDLIEKSKLILTSLCDQAIATGFDKQYGGMFNRFIDNNLVSSNKEWWPQAESVLALFAAYHISYNKTYLSYAIRLLEYIDNTFSDSRRGEWYDTVTREGKPLFDQPKLHPWKSMYHNVRYCIETIKHLEKLFVQV